MGRNPLKFLCVVHMSFNLYFIYPLGRHCEYILRQNQEICECAFVEPAAVLHAENKRACAGVEVDCFLYGKPLVGYAREIIMPARAAMGNNNGRSHRLSA